MKEEQILQALDIRYVDLLFTVEICEDSVLPVYKSSALRGGMGQMLLNQNCIDDRDCTNCGFSSECLVRRMMYARYENQPRFGGEHESNGYIVECLDREMDFPEGSLLEFHLLLFGKTIVYFTQFLQAFYLLGQVGLGKNQVKYRIQTVKNQRDQCVADEYYVDVHQLNISSVRDYARDRAEQFRPEEEIQLIFQTPTAIKYQGRIRTDFRSESLIRSIFRRIYRCDCFEGKDLELMRWEEEMPEILSQHSTQRRIRRYSDTQNTGMELRGITGSVTFASLPETLLLAFAAGEVLHIGSSTSFGFGKYVLSQRE